MGRIRVLVVDDHIIVRQGLISLLVDADEIEIVGEADNGAAAVEAVDGLRPDVVLMDIVMPEMDGAQATATICARWPGSRILILSGSNVRSRILMALRAGALGYISKTSPRNELVEAVQRTHQGLPVMPRDMTSKFLETYPAAAPNPETLTRRETEILKLLAQGLTNQGIAEHAGISEATIRTHVGNIFGKLGINNRVEATLCALRDGLTTLDESLGLA